MIYISPVKTFNSYKSLLGNRVYVAFTLTFLSAISESFGLLMVLPLLTDINITNSGRSENLAVISELVIDIIDRYEISNPFVFIVILIGLSFILKGLLSFLSLSYSALLRADLCRKLKIDFMLKVEEMKFVQFRTKNSSYYSNVVNEQISRVLDNFWFFFLAATQLLNSIVYVIAAFVIAWRFGITALTACIIMYGAFRFATKKVTLISNNIVKCSEHQAKIVNEYMQAYKYLKAIACSKYILNSIIESINAVWQQDRSMSKISAFAQTVREPIAVLLILAILSIHILYIKDSVAPLMISIVLFYRSINSILSVMGWWVKSLETSGSLTHVLDALHERDNESCPEDNYTPSPSKLDVTFYSVYFAYKNRTDPVLRNLNIKIPHNKTVAIVGKSGSGKSTIADLLTMVVKPTQGRMVVDSVDSKLISVQSWRNMIGYVSQDMVIFDESIAYNITLGTVSVIDRNVEKKIINLLEMVGLGDYVSNLSEGIHTKVGDRGHAMSGGQRQRLFLARELFRSPKLLILDEATSALDLQSEIAIRNCIETLKANTTILLIAHRISTIRIADYIYVINDGTVIEEGTYAELSTIETSNLNRLKLLNSS